MEVSAVNWMMCSCVNRYVFVVFLLKYVRQPYQMHNLCLLNNPSMLNSVLIYPVIKHRFVKHFFK